MCRSLFTADVPQAFRIFISDFNLDKYLKSIGNQLGNIGDSLPSLAADKLLEKLGVSMYMLQTKCKSSNTTKLKNGR